MSAQNLKAWRGLISLGLLMALVLCASAGTNVASTLITLYLIRNDPALLERRLRSGPTAEKEKTQQIIMFVALVGFFAALIVPALDHRFGWSNVPLYAVAAGDILIGLAFYLIFLVYRENTFTSATIEVSSNQRVISTGPYAAVRHPMYAGALLLFVGTSLALGSYWGILGFIALLPTLLWRLLDEERFLKRNLQGYADYCDRVRWRLIPKVF